MAWVTLAILVESLESLLGGLDIVMAIVSNKMPRKTTLVEGGQSLLGEELSPS